MAGSSSSNYGNRGVASIDPSVEVTITSTGGHAPDTARFNSVIDALSWAIPIMQDEFAECTIKML